MKYASYRVHHYNRRPDGRIEPTGVERVVLSREEAIALSFTALVVSESEGFGGSQLVLHEGQYRQFDPHLGWTS